LLLENPVVAAWLARKADALPLLPRALKGSKLLIWFKALEPPKPYSSHQLKERPGEGVAFVLMLTPELLSPNGSPTKASPLVLLLLPTLAPEFG
jgi:hypothetical protein